jgi:tetratricopeptide (TPR) repeat protein
MSRTWNKPWLTLVLFLLGAHPLWADKVYFVEPGKPKTYASGKVTEENPSYVKVVGGIPQEREIKSAIVTDVAYEAEDNIDEALKARVGEAAPGPDLASVLGLYEKALLKANPQTSKFLVCHFRYKIASLKARQAEDGVGDRAAAIAALQKFRADYPESRQIVPCLQALGRLLAAEGQSTKDVSDHFERLSKYAKDSPEIMQESSRLKSELLISEARSVLNRNPEEAKQRYAVAYDGLKKILDGLPPGGDPVGRLELELALAECLGGQEKFDEALKETNRLMEVAVASPDEAKRASVYLTRGDCYRMWGNARVNNNRGEAIKQYRKAMWEYLWVDVVYNKDVNQHARALYHLAEIFEKMDDGARAEACKDLLRKDRFKGSNYQRLVAGK